MDKTDAAHALVLALPDPWREVTGADLVAAESFYGESAHALNLAELEHLVQDPSLAIARTAVLYLPLHDSDGDVITTLIASLLAVCVPSETCPSPDSDVFAPEIREDVPIPGGGTATFFTLTVPVFADDSPVAALLTFSSPNVPLAEFLEEGFRSIAASAQLVAPSA